MSFNWRTSCALLATAVVGGAIGIAGTMGLYGDRLDQLDHDVERLDARSAAVARLDPERVKQCLEFSAHWRDAMDHDERKASQSYSDAMGRWNCGEVMDAIRHVR